MTDAPRPRLPTFDSDALLGKLGGDREFFNGLLHVALQSSAALPTELREAVAHGDVRVLADVAHKIKGTAGDFVAAELHQCARKAELAAREGRPEALALCLALADQLDEFVADVRVLLASET
jgi:HPt (histidine-containing phosphotransfer) domain-containing protein